MKDTLPARVRFGAFELDLKAGELWNGESKVVLQEQPFQVLRILVEHGGEVASREEIQKKLWPNDTVVEFDHSINAAINKLRRVLGDSAEEPKYIETVARRGYRLMVPAERVQSSSGAGPPRDELSGTEDAPGVRLKAAPAERVQSSSGAGPPRDELSGTQDAPGVRLRSAPAELTGRTVSHYRVLDVIAAGGMGVVYRAEDLKLGRGVALKFLPEELGSDPRALERFEREARSASSLDHPNICAIHEFGEHEGQPFIVMQLLHGQTLRDRLAALREGRSHAKTMALDQLLNLAIQIADGLEAAHEKGIIHRDIKPANIFITRKGVAKILDFGLAKLLQASEGERALAVLDTQSTPEHLAGKASEVLDHSRPGLILGTAPYMSPEQVRGEPLDARTDLFSFGLVLYEMATGQRAFSGDAAPILHDAILNRKPIPIRELNPDFPPGLEVVIDKCLERDRDLRYQQAGEIRSDLEKVRREAKHPPRRRWALLMPAAAVVALLIVGGLSWRSQHLKRLAQRITEKDTIVLANFANTTGDPVFNEGLKGALAYQLGQSPLLNVLSDNKVSETLKLMNRPANEGLTQEVARGVCQRTDSKALVEGSIEAVGEDYLVRLTAVNCQTGETLANAQAVAENRKHPLKALEKAGNQLRVQLGEELGSVQKFNKPLEEATTPSLEALQAYSQGRKLQSEQGDAAAVPYLKRALDLDPNFAVAYAALGVAYDNRGQTDLALENYRKAYELRDRVSQKERLSIEALYYLGIGELEKAIQIYSEWIQIYPRAGRAHTNLAFSYRLLGQYEKSVNEARESIRLIGDNVADYNNLILDYIAMNQPDKAKAAFDDARARKLDDPFLHFSRYSTAFLQGDDATMRQEVGWATGQRGVEDMFLSAQSDSEAYYGRFGKARDFSRRAVDSARHADALEPAAGWKANAALREAEIGNASRARQMAAEAVSLEPGRDVRAIAALTLARVGDAARAQKLVDQLNHEFPRDTIMQGYSLPTIRAAIELEKNNPGKAIEGLQAVTSYEMGGQSFLWLYPAYVRGQAYLKAGQGQEAAAEFQKMLDHPGIMLNFVTGALVHLQMARAQTLLGDQEGARKSYRTFFDLWKNADTDLTVLKTAQAEYGKLK